MQPELSKALRAELERLASLNRLRDLPRSVDVEPRYDFVSNDYLSLASTRGVAGKDLRRGAGAARLLGGTSPEIDEVEAQAAEWLGEESALCFPSGYQANAALFQALVRAEDVLILDEKIHASVIDGARLSRARRLIHRHLDLEDLEARLREARIDVGDQGRLFIATESVFSMSGEGPDFEALDALAREYGAHLIVDEAHAVGILGPEGCGLAPSHRYPSVAARVATGGKALGAAGAFIVGDRCLHDLIVNRGRGFIFSTGVSPRVAADLVDSIERIRKDDEGRRRLAELRGRLCAGLGVKEPKGAIVYLAIGAEKEALDAAKALQDLGFAVRAVRPPTVAPGDSGLRLVVHRHNDDASIDALLAAIPDALRHRKVQRAPSALPVDEKKAGAEDRAARTVWIVGTDTDVGKTVASAVTALALSEHQPTIYWKPVQTGDDDDTDTVAALVEDQVERREPRYRFDLPASPHTAAAAEGAAIEYPELIRAFREHLNAAQDSSFVVELAGGLLVPLCEGKDQGDLLADTEGRIVLVARSGLGTLNHTLLTAEALRRREKTIDILLLVGEPHPENEQTLQAAQIAGQIFTLPRFSSLSRDSLRGWSSFRDFAEALRK